MNDIKRYPLRGEIAELLRPILKEKADFCEERLLTRYQSLEGIFSASPDELAELVGSRAAAGINLLARITSRRLTEGFEFGKRHTDCELIDYLKALFIGLSEEHLYLISIGDNQAILSVDLISVGTVNSAAVIPRNIIEMALKRHAKSIMIVHNHPGGKAEPSSEDNGVASTLADVSAKAGIHFSGHIVIAGNKYMMTAMSGN